ncbi:SLOG domain-containing protein [Parabacteroides goldsteinii]|uniref:SLOG domain-containing protein n=1 Tax=Parabacteroides goldsteinii TaxID=328812 RepID=UPI00189B54BC|nr:hypothetical protein [Parabacteroides goldsteinii]
MDEQTLKCIFLSASIPIPGRDDEKYLNTADVIAIRDAVIALASVTLPKFHLVWGGHPSITPLISNVLKHSDVTINNCVTLYQSKQYEEMFPIENREIGSKIFTEKGANVKDSLYIMRRHMLSSHDFVAGIFIGGMNGVEDEYQMFIDLNPKALLIPVASTGAAAKIIFEQEKTRFNSRLESDMAYFSLFKDLLP